MAWLRLILPAGPVGVRILRLLGLICLLGLPGRSRASDHAVTVYYLITSEYNFNQDENDAIIAAALDIQAWYQVATGGMTFELVNPGSPVVINLPNNSPYYEATGYVGRIAEDLVAMGVNLDEPGSIKLFFIKGGGGCAAGAQGCNANCGWGMIGMDLFPEFNTGMYFDCPGGNGGQAFPCTPLGAAAHEIGHAFGLPHPFEEYPIEVSIHSLMHTHWNYPYYWAIPEETPWGLLTHEREALRANPFFQTGIALSQVYPDMPVVNIPDLGDMPTADFTFSVDGLEVTFENTSSGADLYYWVFENGDVSTEEHPVYTFPEFGLHEVILRASSPTGMMDMLVTTISVCNMTTSISATATEVCGGESVTITATGGESYDWSTGETTPTITVPVFDPETFSVTISDDNGCSAEESIYIDALPSPDPFIFTDPEDGLICLGQSATLQATGGGTYAWSTGDEGQSIVVTPGETTAYTVTVTNAFDCQAVAAVTIEVSPVPIATVAVSQNNVCPLDTVILTAGGGATFLWSTGATTAQITLLPADSTTYSVTVSNAGGCSSSASAPVYVYPSPGAAIASPDTVFCPGDSVMLTGGGNGDFLWSTGDTLNIANVLITRDTTFALTVTSGEGCADVASVSLAVYTLPDPVITVSSDSVCVGEVVILTGPAAESYLWANGDTTQVSLQSFADTAIIGLTVVDTNQCAYPLTASVYVKPQTTFEVVGPASLCQGDSIELVIQPAFPAYAWSTGCTSQNCVITSADTIWVSILDTLGCTSSITRVIAGDDTYGVTLSGATAICEGEETVLSMPEGFVAYAWSTGADTSSIVVQESGVYTVTITGTTGCFATDSAYVEVLPLPVVSLVYDGATVSAVGLDSLAAYTYQWNTGHTESVITVDTAGQYCLTLTDAFGCSAAGCLDVVITRTEDALSHAARVYPNPFDRYLFLEVEGGVVGSVLVFDLLNRPVLVTTVSSATGVQLDFGELPAGVYIVAIPVGPGLLRSFKVVKM